MTRAQFVIRDDNDDNDTDVIDRRGRAGSTLASQLKGLWFSSWFRDPLV
jgi:hypothetical protein